MSFIIEQKIKGRTYLYEVESYWDKEKKQPRQRRKYLGPKEPLRTSNSKQCMREVTVKKYGAVFLLKNIAERIGLRQILSDVFPEYYEDILNLSYYQIINNSAEYLFKYWIEESYLPGSKKLSSEGLSELYIQIGKSESERELFLKRWIKQVKSVKGVYYDITSISSYSKNNELIEWGYNRDGEGLPQLNLGLVYSKENSLPIYYRIFSGSLPDVKTLKNTIKYLSHYGMKEYLLVLDRGFFSGRNILELAKSDSNILFIQPLPFSLKRVKELAKKYSKATSDYSNAFLYENTVLYHRKDKISFDNREFSCHIFLNEKVKQEEKENFIKTLLTIEEQFKGIKINTLKEYKSYMEENIPLRYRKYFKWSKKYKTIEKDQKAINEFLAKSGVFVIATNSDLDKKQIIDYYRSKDAIEKLFDVVKNELLGKRLRGHSKDSTQGRIFVKFITTILYSQVAKTMKENNLFKTYSVRELMLELNKIKRTELKEDYILSELTKKQRKIFKAFNIQLK